MDLSYVEKLYGKINKESSLTTAVDCVVTLHHPQSIYTHVE